MTEQVQDQYEQWSRAKSELASIFGRARPFNVKEQCIKLFHLNILSIWPLISPYALEAPQPELAANIIAILNSELPDIGEKVLQQVLAVAKSQLKEFGGDTSCPNSIIMCGYLFNLEAIDAFPLLQILVCLVRKQQWKLVTNLLAISGKKLAKVSSQSYEYIRTQAGPHETKEWLDIVLDKYKNTHQYDIMKVSHVSPVFDFDTRWTEKQAEYEKIRVAILGEDEEDEDEDEDEDDDDDNDGEEEEQSRQLQQQQEQPVASPTIIDTTNREQVALRKTIYLTIMSTMSTQEACHKLLSLGNRDEVVNMLFESCKQEKIYNKTFGNIGYYLCRVGNVWQNSFNSQFGPTYSALQDLSTREIRNLGTLCGYLLASKSISWTVFEIVKIDPDNSTPSNRIFLQALFEEMRREIGLDGIKTQFSQLSRAVAGGVFPDGSDLTALRFSINFFTAIKMGPLTDDMRVELKRRE